MSVAESRNPTLEEQLAQQVGADHVLTDDDSRVLYSQDVYTKGIPAMAVVTWLQQRPQHEDRLAQRRHGPWVAFA